jgi:alpha-glucoside transport system permease protein
LANAILTFFGAQPQTFAQSTSAIGLNNIFLIIILVWLQTGYAMVLFSAAIKGVPSDLLEAARVDGASEIQIFFSIIIPVITGTIITVTTTVVIATLKVFDVVWVMTGGQYDTQVIGTQFYRESFTSGNSGTGSALAIILLLAVVPVMIYNLRDFSKRRTF